MIPNRFMFIGGFFKINFLASNIRVFLPVTRHVTHRPLICHDEPLKDSKTPSDILRRKHPNKPCHLNNSNSNKPPKACKCFSC